MKKPLLLLPCLRLFFIGIVKTENFPMAWRNSDTIARSCNHYFQIKILKNRNILRPRLIRNSTWDIVFEELLASKCYIRLIDSLVLTTCLPVLAYFMLRCQGISLLVQSYLYFCLVVSKGICVHSYMILYVPS